MKNNIILGYQFTGIEKECLENSVGKLAEIIKNLGYDIFFSLTLEEEFQKQKMSYEEIYQYCMNQQALKNTFLGVIEHPLRSNGVEMELKFADKLGQKKILLIRKGLGNQNILYKGEQKNFSMLYHYCDKIYEYTNFEELLNNIKNGLLLELL